MSAKGRRWTCLARLLLGDRGLGDLARSGCWAGSARTRPSPAPAGGDHGLALADPLGGVEEVEERSSGLPISGLITPWTPLGTILPVTALAGSVISLTWAVDAGGRGDRADQAVAVDHRVVDADAVAAADVDRHARVPDRRRAGDHPPGDRCRSRTGCRPRSPASLRSCAFSCSAASPPAAWRRSCCDLRPQAVVLAARVEGLVDPVDEVAGRLQRPVGDVLQRAEDGADAPLEAARALAVGDGQQDEGADDQQGQHRPTAANLLSVHGYDLSWRLGLKAS